MMFDFFEYFDHYHINQKTLRVHVYYRRLRSLNCFINYYFLVTIS